MWVTPFGRVSRRPPQVRTITFISQQPHLPHGIREALNFFLVWRVVPPCMALYEISVRRPETLPCGDLSTPQSGFFQIPPHDGHPCIWLTVPASKSVADFHHQVIAHAGRTNKRTADRSRQLSTPNTVFHCLAFVVIGSLCLFLNPCNPGCGPQP